MAVLPCAALGAISPGGCWCRFSAYLAVLAGRGSVYGASFMAAGADALTFFAKSMDFSGKAIAFFKKYCKIKLYRKKGALPQDEEGEA